MFFSIHVVYRCCLNLISFSPRFPLYMCGGVVAMHLFMCVRRLCNCVKEIIFNSHCVGTSLLSFYWLNRYLIVSDQLDWSFFTMKVWLDDRFFMCLTRCALFDCELIRCFFLCNLNPLVT